MEKIFIWASPAYTSHGKNKRRLCSALKVLKQERNRLWMADLAII